MSSDAPRGLPLLSGPPPSFSDSGHAEIACRKCNKEFNFLFTRARKCNHCGFSYCHSCTDYQALMPRSGSDTGYDSMHVCAFCIELLQITAGGKNYLKSLPLSKLKKYVNAYHISVPRAVEKEDLIEGIINARRPNGCLPPENENYYRRHSVPNKIPPGRPRGLFSRSADAPPPVPPQRPTPTTPTFNFPRPDLEPDHPPSGPSSGPGRGYNPQYTQAPPPPPRPQPQPYHHYPPPPNPPPRPHSAAPHPSHQSFGYAGGYSGSTYHHQQQYQSPPYHSSSMPGGPPPPPPQNSRPSNTSNDWYNAGANTRPSPQQPRQSPASRPPPPPPPPPSNTRPTSTASSSAPPPAPPPSLDELLIKTPDEIGALSIGTLKSILFTNHVNARQILEKSELVRKVLELVEDEKREREEQRRREEWEEMERQQLEEERAQERELERQRAQARSAESDAQAERERNGHMTANLRAWVEEASPSDGGRVPGGSRESIVGGVVADDGPLLELNEPRQSPPSEHTSDGRDSPSDVGMRSATPVPPTQPSLPVPIPPTQEGAHTRSASSTSATSPPRPRPMERTGLCVVCQDEEANIAIVDCGHLAMCRGCSDLIMSSSRECPLCRTRIVTEQRLLRIFKT